MPVVKSYPQASQNNASARFATEQLGQGWVAELMPIPALTALESGADPSGAGLETEALLASGVWDGFMGAPQVSQ